MQKKGKEKMENSRYKFRAWDKLRKLMFDIYDLGKEQSSSENGVTCPNSDLEIMQYTGLKDKNGVEIYEGDILEVCNGSINNKGWLQKYPVEYVLNSGFNMCMFCWDKKGNDRMDSTHYCEVIGNIYENPELLKD
jgi:uncharacterized phage protein (TIGR01671 family)